MMCLEEISQEEGHRQGQDNHKEGDKATEKDDIERPKPRFIVCVKKLHQYLISYSPTLKDILEINGYD